MSMTATARHTGTGLEHEIGVNGRHTIVTDEPERLGGSDRGPAPHELLPATLASCIATMIAMYARNRGWEIGETIVDVDYDPERVPRLFTIEIRPPDGLTAEQQQRLERVARTCPVRRALEGGFSFDERVIADRGDRREPGAAPHAA